jgi:hypothetical protein
MITAAFRRPDPVTEMTIRATGLEYAAGIIHAVCQFAGAPSLVDDLQTEGIVEAIDRHDTATLFDWLVAALSFQGISNRIAYGYMARHGQATWDDIARNLTRAPLLRDNQDENSATIRMRIWRRCRAVGRA